MSEILWQPDKESIKKTNMYAFIEKINAKHGLYFTHYDELYKWSCEHIQDFWAALWDYAEVINSQPYREIIDDPDKMPGAKWFQGAKLNFAENLLRFRDEQTAIIFRGEDQVKQSLSYAELYHEVAGTAMALRDMGVKTGDRVAGFMPNMPQTIIAMLATASIGAIWSSCSPDFGIKGVLDRFGQIEPKVLFTADGYFFKGKTIDSLGRIADILKTIKSVEQVVVVPYTQDKPDITGLPKGILYDDFKVFQDYPITFEQLPFEHPLFVMYSSGTTGLPKCMVQSAGGILLHHYKELKLHTNLTRRDTIFYFTTCGWMMWNWLTSSLALGATIVLFDGNPFHPNPETLWQMAQDEKITVFGTSAGYISALATAGIRPREKYNLTPLRTLLSTGSPLSEEGFDFIYKEIKPDLQLASICGGTDLNGCFALGNPMGPVYKGELQCRGLAMRVKAFAPNGAEVINQQGELVCTGAFPSMPIYFWDDADGQKYQQAYFDVYPGIWCHGDYIEINDHGGVKIYGRSDTTLNPGGVRIGTAEIYRQLEQLSEVEDSLVVGQTWKKDVRIILFVKLGPHHDLTQALVNKIKQTIRINASPRHIPAKIIKITDIPYTLNMKKVELAVKKVIHGEPVLNRDALRNPQALDLYVNLSELEED